MEKRIYLTTKTREGYKVKGSTALSKAIDSRTARVLVFYCKEILRRL